MERTDDASIDTACGCALPTAADAIRARTRSVARKAALIYGLTFAPFFIVSGALTYHQMTRPPEVRTLEKIERDVDAERDAAAASQIKSLESLPAVVQYRQTERRYRTAQIPVVLLACGGVLGGTKYLFKKLSEP